MEDIHTYIHTYMRACTPFILTCTRTCEQATLSGPRCRGKRITRAWHDRRPGMKAVCRREWRRLLLVWALLLRMPARAL